MHLRYNKQPIDVSVDLPGSKSLSNRILILQELLGLEMEIRNLSEAKDTVDLRKAIVQIRDGKDPVIDIGHAGTDMRFLTALLSVTDGEWQLTGSSRMKERPIGELVNALTALGAEITYTEKKGFPPLKIKGHPLKGGQIEVDGSISSQFVSALALIAPALEKGLEIRILNKIVSWPYIRMTLDLLSELGLKVSASNRSISIQSIRSHPHTFLDPGSEFVIESDWSAASYWFSIAALNSQSKVKLNKLYARSSQGDSVLTKIYSQLGVRSVFEKENLLLLGGGSRCTSFVYDFTDCPDIAQTVAVTCLGLNIPCELNGLSTLKHKETDRLAALKTEIEKFGVKVSVTGDSLSFSAAALEHSKLNNSVSAGNPRLTTGTFRISTYGDHRMAMSFAPLALLTDLEIEAPEVIEKSYPKFWEHLQKVGIC